MRIKLTDIDPESEADGRIPKIAGGLLGWGDDENDGIPEAPIDGTAYVRKDAGWVAESGGGGGGVPEGTSFPGSPADGDRFFRTDQMREYFYKGSESKWFTSQTFCSGNLILTNGNTGSGNDYRYPHPGHPYGKDIFVESASMLTNIGGSPTTIGTLAGWNGTSAMTIATLNATGSTGSAWVSTSATPAILVPVSYNLIYATFSGSTGLISLIFEYRLEG